ncbi:conserved hypothetical protein [Paraburkholderia ribeironis]|uniref:Ava_C0101 and related proteins n=1 Tax=Paraburkholderia ribeironis TaxID=1247936 RepID=A0A1N7SHV0_9BURK|nr:DUF5996 family protein [Paraburkholderia ribeironis]SIT46541.1 conserved hypothetical protein [Paraburkholderia ribeironis]
MQNPGHVRSFWPALDYAQSRNTLQTLHLWTQIVGKVRLTLSPWVNHGWQVALYVTARGLGTSTIYAAERSFEIVFDLVDHRLIVRSSEGPDRGFALAPMSVASFYHQLMSELRAAGVTVSINVTPNEVPSPIRFPDDEVHASYDADAAHRFWRALAQSDRVFKVFQTSFLGKCSPTHFFWGSFDLAATRFSGRRAPMHPGGIPSLPDPVAQEAYSHEVSSAGFWPGNETYPNPAFYSYAYPSPTGFAQARVEPSEALWSDTLGEWLLPYDAVRNAADPDAALLAFLNTTFRAAADLADWDRGLECGIGVAGTPRAIPD